MPNDKAPEPTWIQHKLGIASDIDGWMRDIRDAETGNILLQAGEWRCPDGWKYDSAADHIGDAIYYTRERWCTSTTSSE
jgi:hypothetical protein